MFEKWKTTEGEVNRKRDDGHLKDTHTQNKNKVQRHQTANHKSIIYQKKSYLFCSIIRQKYRFKQGWYYNILRCVCICSKGLVFILTLTIKRSHILTKSVQINTTIMQNIEFKIVSDTYMIQVYFFDVELSDFAVIYVNNVLQNL